MFGDKVVVIVEELLFFFRDFSGECFLQVVVGVDQTTLGEGHQVQGDVFGKDLQVRLVTNLVSLAREVGPEKKNSKFRISVCNSSYPVKQ